jgi:hypothetical protein
MKRKELWLGLLMVTLVVALLRWAKKEQATWLLDKQ